MTPSPAYAHGNPSETPQPQPPEHTLRSPRESPSASIPDFVTNTRSPSFSAKSILSGSESRQPSTPATSSLSKSRSPSGSRSQSNDRSSVSTRDSSPSVPVDDGNQEHRQTIVRSFVPRVAVYASEDTNELVGQKGFIGGLHTLLRPYGERLQSRVIIRDSIGSSKGFDDFGVRFIDCQDLQRASTGGLRGANADHEVRALLNGAQYGYERPDNAPLSESGSAIDQLLNHYLRAEDSASNDSRGNYVDDDGRSNEPRSTYSPLYPIYLRKILSGSSLVPYETFSHPVACLIAVSSHHPAPIEALRQLYASTGHGGNKTPAWVGTEYLRYYVLIHDEENHDITKSTALFDLMKRHFGLHCHLLRLRTSQCVQTDDDSTKVPVDEWLSAEEEIGLLRSRDYANEFGNPERYIFESDASAIKALLREMVSQSIVPFMESRIMTWNDQVASRRRGISGRFMSLSKRWAGFGSNKGAASGSSGASNASGSNYDYQRGFYPPETPEATMRQLGDYAFMLRDWKLAHSTYDLLRADFSHDKAWSYHAAANEMAAITSLLVPQTYNSKHKLEAIDQILDTAAYSYLTRCSMPSRVVRCFTLAIELLKNRGSIAADDAARWGGKLLEYGVLDPIAQALTSERIAECYMSRTVHAVPTVGSRRRQAALWNILSADSWVKLDNAIQARVRFEEANVLYRVEHQQNSGPSFPSMQAFWGDLARSLHIAHLNGPQSLVEYSDGDVSGQLEFSTLGETQHLSAFTRPGGPDKSDIEGFTPQDAGRPNPDFGNRSDGFE